MSRFSDVLDDDINVKGMVKRTVEEIQNMVADGPDETMAPENNNVVIKEGINGNDAQFAKADMGKDPISLVPPEIMRCCARIRAYGVAKYHAPNSWVLIEKQRYVDAMMRHLLSYLEGDLVDDESGLPHLWHAACNMAFICEMEKPNWEEIKNRMINSDKELQKEIKEYNEKEDHR